MKVEFQMLDRFAAIRQAGLQPWMNQIQNQ